MLPLYIHRNSPVHKFPAAIKLLACLGVSAAICFVSSPLALGFITAAIVALYALARLPFSAIVTALRPVFVAAFIICALQMALAGWLMAASVVLRFLALVLLSGLASLTTPFSDMLEVLTNAARPFARFGISPAKLALAVALTIRFIPSLLHDLQEIQRARIARGGRALSIFALGPLLVKILSMTNALGDAIAARGFENRK